MASETEWVRIPSPLPNDVTLRHIPNHDSMALQRWFMKVNFFANQSVPINRLPTELLAEILRLVRISSCPPNWSFATVLLTCRHWYCTAVSSSTLWTRLSHKMSLPLVKTYLRRSRGATLSLSTRFPTTAVLGAAFLESLSPHLNRVTRMSTTSSQTYIEHRMELLSSLIIDDRSPLPQNHATPPSHHIVTIHCDRFPKLNFLTLRDIGPVARIVNGHSLTSLKLQALLHDTWDELFDLLRSCPALEYLKLASLEAESTAIDDGASHHIVEMRHLRTLTLKDFCEPRGMLSLLAYFALPRTARINVSTYMNAGDIDDEPGGSGETVFAHMFPEDKTSSSVFSDIRSMQIVLSHKCLDLGASTSKVPSADTYSITASCNLVGSQFNPKSIQKQIMLELCTALSTSLKTLHIHVEAHDDYGGGSATESWKSLYTAFPRLEYLYAGGPSISFFADFLRDLGPDLPVQPSPLPWPKLKLIKFANTSTKEDPVESEVLIQSITTSLCNRRDAASGKCLRRLTLVFPEAPPHLETYLGQLRRVTAKLVYTVRGERIVLDDGVPIAAVGPGVADAP